MTCLDLLYWRAYSRMVPILPADGRDHRQRFCLLRQGLQHDGISQIMHQMNKSHHNKQMQDKN